MVSRQVPPRLFQIERLSFSCTVRPADSRGDISGIEHVCFGFTLHARGPQPDLSSRSYAPYPSALSGQ